MPLPIIFANLPAGNTPAAYLDQDFAALGSFSIIPCTAAGTNSIALTPVANTPSVAAYNQLQSYRFVAANTTTAAATVQFSALAALPAYKPSSSGPVATASGDIVIGEAYDAVYDLALNSGAGGFHIFNVISAAGSSGRIVQVVNFETGAVASGTTVIPQDDTIPQNTEGDQYMQLAITPTNAAHFLIIQAVVNVSAAITNVEIVAALFQDSIANALSVGGVFHTNTASSLEQIVLSFYMTAGTTSATTFKVRAGSSSAGTTTFNGRGGARLYGGVLTSSITITEIS